MPQRSLKDWLLNYIAWGAVILFVGIGGLLFWQYHDWPVVRNALVYGNIVYHLIDIGAEFSAGVDAYNKPLGFAYLAYFPVKWWGANLGLQVTSFVGTTFWAASLILWFRSWAPLLGVSHKNILVWLCLTLANPLVVYQFVSAYPDTWYALAFGWSVYALDKWLSESRKAMWWGIGFVGLMLLSIWVKHNGFILLPILVLFSVVRWRVFWSWWIENRQLIYWYVGVLVLLLIMLFGLQFGWFGELFNLAQNSGNYTAGQLDRLTIMGVNLWWFVVWLALSFSVVGPLLLKYKPHRRNVEWYGLVILIFLSLWWYHGTKYNIRYYLPVLPVVSLMIIAVWQRFEAFFRWSMLGMVLSCNIFLTVAYHTPNLFEHLPLPQFDNLRTVNEHQLAQRDVEYLNQFRVNFPKARLVWVSSYYNDGAWQVWERSGLILGSDTVVYSKELSQEFWIEVKADHVILMNYMSTEFVQPGAGWLKVHEMGNVTVYAREVQGTL